MQEIFNEYINYLKAERNASPYTVRNYTTDLRDFFQLLSAKEVSSLRAVDRHVLRDYLAWLMERGIARSSIARKLSAVRSFYGYLLREGIVDANPAVAISSPKLGKRLPSFLSVEETVRLLTAPDSAKREGQRDRALLELLYASGLRVSELVSLNVEQVNLESGEIRVLGKGSKERMVLMGKPAVRELTTYLSQGRPNLIGKKKTNALFLTDYKLASYKTRYGIRHSVRLTVKGVQELLGKHAKAAGIDKRVHPHMLRHTFATHLLDGGADLRVVQELLGHANLSSTQIYTHVTKSQARKVYLSAHPMAQEKDTELENS